MALSVAGSLIRSAQSARTHSSELVDRIAPRGPGQVVQQVCREVAARGGVQERSHGRVGRPVAQVGRLVVEGHREAVHRGPDDAVQHLVDVEGPGGGEGQSAVDEDHRADPSGWVAAVRAAAKPPMA